MLDNNIEILPIQSLNDRVIPLLENDDDKNSRALLN
jgi:hypothetical protein